jgi:acylphosphatase
MNNTAFSIHIQGRVQGVGFRYTCTAKAQQLGIHGWVKNVGTDSVEIWAEGPAEAQTRFLAWLQQGPPQAQVKSVQATPEKPTGKYPDFSVKY